MSNSMSAEELNERFKDFQLKGEYVGATDPNARLRVFGNGDSLLLDLGNEKGACLLVVEIKETLVGDNTVPQG